jgi:hypothetical protein
MNWAEIQSNWQHSKTLLKTHWPMLSDEELNTIGGERERLAKSLQKHYGCGASEAERLIAEFEKDVRYPGAVK